MKSVKALISVLKAKATIRPMAMTTTSPRNRKFLNPLIMRGPYRQVQARATTS